MSAGHVRISGAALYTILDTIVTTPACPNGNAPYSRKGWWHFVKVEKIFCLFKAVRCEPTINNKHHSKFNLRFSIFYAPLRRKKWYKKTPILCYNRSVKTIKTE